MVHNTSTDHLIDILWWSDLKTTSRIVWYGYWAYIDATTDVPTVEYVHPTATNLWVRNEYGFTSPTRATQEVSNSRFYSWYGMTAVIDSYTRETAAKRIWSTNVLCLRGPRVYICGGQGERARELITKFVLPTVGNWLNLHVCCIGLWTI
jgi:hypothetical protein